jgi:hypothetical protein
MNDPRLERFAEAYLAMARQARYRPQAPPPYRGSDGQTVLEAVVEVAERARPSAAAPLGTPSRSSWMILPFLVLQLRNLRLLVLSFRPLRNPHKCRLLCPKLAKE